MTLDPNSEIAPGELGALMDMDEPEILALMPEDGPFRPEASGFLRLRVALGIVVYAFLGLRALTDPKLAALAAIEAANGADPDADKSLMVAWHKGKPAMGWFDAETALPERGDTFGAAMRMPVVTIPADRMLRDLGAALLSLREQSRGTAH